LKLESKIKDPSQANRKVSIWLLRWVSENFRSEGGKVGGWLPFKHGGRVTKKGINTSAKLLQDTGALRKSYQPFYSRVNAGVGSDIPYSAFHEFGVPMNNLPIRRMLPSGEDREVQDAVIRIYDAHIKRAAND
jgi:phage gpG-like protein